MIRNRTRDTNSNVNPGFPAFLARKNPPRGNSSSGSQETILVEKGKLRVHIPVQNILFVKSEHVYCRIFFLDDQRTLQRISLDKLLMKLPEDSFLRVHRSFLVNVNHVRKFSSSKVLIGEKTIPIGRTWKDSVVPRLRKMTAEISK